MKILLITCLLILSAIGDFAQAFRCGQQLVPDKATLYQVRRICGEPIDVQQWVETRIATAHSFHRKSFSQQGRYHPDAQHSSVPVLPIVIPITVEEWTYDFGPTQFMRVFRFENGRLRRIRALEKGDTH